MERLEDETPRFDKKFVKVDTYETIVNKENLKNIEKPKDSPILLNKPRPYTYHGDLRQEHTNNAIIIPLGALSRIDQNH